MNTVVNRTAGSAVAALQSLSSALSNVAATLPTSGGDPYLRLQKDGTWVYGQENTEIEPGSTWAVNIFSIEHGYSCWTDHPKDPKTGKQPKNEKVGEVMVGASQAKPVKTTLPDHSPWEWRDQVSVQIKGYEGEDAGTELLYNTTALGGTNAIKGLIDAIQKQLVDDIAHPVPIVELQSDSYVHGTWGKTYFPVFEIVGWMSVEGAEAVKEVEELAPAPEPASEPAKPPRTRRASTVPATGKAETPQPQHETVAQAVEQATLNGETPVQRMRRELAEAEAAEAAAAAKANPQMTRAVDLAVLAKARQEVAGDTGVVRRRRNV